MADELHTARLRLRRATMDDLDAVHLMLSDPAAMRYWSTPPHTDVAQSEAWLRSMIDVEGRDSDDYLIERDGEVIGKVGGWKLPDIGFLLRSDHWGQGLGSEALSAFLARRRTIGKPARLTADVDPRNAASLALLTKHGFVETHRAVGTWNVGGEICDSVYLALDL